MESRVLFLLVTFSALNTFTLAQVATLCRPNERYLSCGGCQKTCSNPAPPCAAVCREGCYCPEDMVRNNTGHCVTLSECPVTNLSQLSDTSEPRSLDLKCPENEEYRFCEPCNKTCDNPNPICPAECARGCFCKDNLVRNRNGKCVSIDLCEKKRFAIYVPPEDACGKNQVYKNCSSCDKHCGTMKPFCVTQCINGCFCSDGFARGPDHECVPMEKCPKVSMITAEMSSMGAHELTVEDCAPEEEYLSCGWCEPTCSDPKPNCPKDVCTRGCLCKPPLVRHYNGLCVDIKNCLPQKCPDQNEEYLCRYGCEHKCTKRYCDVRPRGCTLGCHCKLGLLRNNNGTCVLPENC